MDSTSPHNRKKIKFLENSKRKNLVNIEIGGPHFGNVLRLSQLRLYFLPWLFRQMHELAWTGHSANGWWWINFLETWCYWFGNRVSQTGNRGGKTVIRSELQLSTKTHQVRRFFLHFEANTKSWKFERQKLMIKIKKNKF